MRRAVLAVVAGLVLAGGAPAGWLLSQGDGGQFGTAAAQDLRAADSPQPTLLQPALPRPAAPRPVPTGRATAVPDPAPLARPVGTRSARLPDVVAPRDPPVAVHLAGRTAPLDAVGLDGDRQVVVPDDVRRAGWYAAGPQPGDRAGSAVLVGHADDAEQGLGTFAALRALPAGAEVVVRTASGRDLVYEVVAFERFAKAEVPMSRLFATDGAHRLVLISCGGAFDPVRRTYADNVVVTAVPRP
ncbi:MAG: hypothetical protein AVDCRST_MAG07-51 [uncultured Frankineae bacterium]|uniref:Peptidase C60, sortase A and B n=1 Tax=uncultured Frankineae bacterium TaxID=437475 RepID=A0A6J4KGJ0_9ACTN|nr:MAG: hypothetical protein AVDCRST_MAG07-51 [uncultured Frankineae bacterium]